MLVKLLKDEAGLVDVSGYILTSTIVVIGVLVGVVAVRDSVVQELGDVSLALEKIDQSYTVNCTIGGQPLQFGYNDTPLGPDDVAGEAPACIAICLPATFEGAGGGGGGGGPLEATPE